MDEDNVYRGFRSIDGGKPDGEDKAIPVNNYVIVDIEKDEFYATGFLFFTPHHLAIMRDVGDGPIPVFCMPIERVKAAELDEEFDETV